MPRKLAKEYLSQIQSRIKKYLSVSKNREFTIGVCLISFVTISTIAIIIGYFIVNRTYILYLEIPFIHNIAYGTKVRLNASVKIGEVVNIESDLHKHKIHIAIKKQVRLPKRQTKISIKTWGYFGEKFINIHVLPAKKYENFYEEYDSVKVKKEENILSGAILKMIKNNSNINEQPTFLLDSRLKNIRRAMKKLNRDPYFQPYFINTIKKRLEGYRNTIIAGKANRLVLNKQISSALDTAQTFVLTLKKRQNSVNSSQQIRSDYHRLKESLNNNVLLTNTDLYYLLYNYITFLDNTLKEWSNNPSELFNK